VTFVTKFERRKILAEVRTRFYPAFRRELEGILDGRSGVVAAIMMWSFANLEAGKKLSADESKSLVPRHLKSLILKHPAALNPGRHPATEKGQV
jgi:hypothetical protein